MMRIFMLIMTLLICGALFAEPRGMTNREIIVEDAISGIQPPAVLSPLQNIRGKAKTGTSAKADTLPKISTPPAAKDWLPVISQPLEILLPAGEQFGLRFNNLGYLAEPFSSVGELLPQSLSAIIRAPNWIRVELHKTLNQLTTDKQLLFADLINTAPDIYVDEIAFCIATSSVEYLSSSFALPQLFYENAQDIYSFAAELPYVEVIDTGNASTGGDYWSTTRYWKKGADGILVQVDVPRDVYYWYIVHPKLTDEIPAYIDPLILENNSTHSNNIVPPPVGKFWRNYIYTLDDTVHPILRDSLMVCPTLFNRDGSSGDAIHAIMLWISQNMSFTSNNERPHQPVRIIEKGFGRCGEYADLTAAIARLALIPCTSISSISTDHVWNEFWESDWVQWEPVNGYVNSPLVYENGWGKVFGSVFETRSDGLLSPVTDRYSEGLATINIQVVDENMLPVDAARVVLAIFETSPRFDCEQFTDNDGMVTFLVGENRDYRARAETFFGLYPEIAGTYTQLVSSSVSGETYNYQFVIPAEFPVPAIETLDLPPDPLVDYRFQASFQSPGYYIAGRTLWDDIDVLGIQPLHYKKVDQASNVRFMVTDSDNLLFYQIDNWCSAYVNDGPVEAGSVGFNIPIGQDWYAFLDNSHRHGNAVLLSGSLSFEQWSTATEDPQVPPAMFALSSAIPNPMNGETNLLLALGTADQISLDVYNLRGQKVLSQSPDLYAAGLHDFTWNGRDNSGAQVPSGLYLIKVRGTSFSAVRKVVVAK